MRAAAARRGTVGEVYQKLARESTGQILVKHRRDHRRWGTMGAGDFGLGDFGQAQLDHQR